MLDTAIFEAFKVSRFGLVADPNIGGGGVTVGQCLYCMVAQALLQRPYSCCLKKPTAVAPKAVGGYLIASRTGES